MTKKEYLKPEMQVVEIDIHAQILAGSVTSVSTTGLDVEDELVLPGEGLPKSGSVWEDAW
ncbi:MAG: hypothetical protein J6P41_04645 [Prevotella sp.]|nr:hypothetical protein [Prevotella sp.]